MENIKECKKELRKRIAALKKEKTAQWKLEESMRIMSKVEELGQFAAAGTVLLYYALPDEVQTEFFIKKWYGKKRIALPVVCGDDLVLKEYDPALVKPGYKDIPEPVESAPEISPEEVEFAVIPGVAFDRKANRMGRGKGFYDRLIPSLKCAKYGVAYDFQMVESVPVEPFDKPLDGIVY